MSDWQWQVILALIRVVLQNQLGFKHNYMRDVKPSTDIALLHEALNREERRKS